MVMIIKYLLFILLVVFVVGAAYFSTASRRAADPLDKGKKRSIMNVMMGAMLVTLALMSMFLFQGSTLNIIVEAAFLVMGAFNIFSGLRSHGYYSRLKN
ncbi:YtpI family protein [Paenibacillus sp. BR2-3]|uniref:YtpI family protein n=1 Tax=Paenibacillus sp. BR2-3 TaxID=3048494 RepID=UPI0039777E2C